MSVVDYGQRTYVDGKFPIDYELSGNPNSKNLVVFFHGYGQHFGFMKKKFSSLFGDAQFLFINGPYPLAPEITDEIPKIKLRYAWYFFNPLTKKYFISPDTPALIIKNLISSLNLESKNILFFGFSQGGYLAPFVSKFFKKSTVIAVNSNIRYDLLPKKIPMTLFSINGENDKIVDPQNARNSTEAFCQQGNVATHIMVKESGHYVDENILIACRQVIEKSFI